MIDKEKLLSALRNSKQSPVACDLLIHQIEQGDFDIAEATVAHEKKKAPKAPSD